MPNKTFPESQNPTVESNQNTVIEHLETLAEAVANSVTHGLGFFLSISAFITLIIYAMPSDNTLKMASSIIYGGALVAMYGSSTLYHSLPHSYSALKRFFRILDHSAIYLLIAGTYTPFALVTIHGNWGWILFGIQWGLALFGIAFKLVYGHRYELLSTVIYLFMGWIGMVAIMPIWHALAAPGLWWLLAGGLIYMVGVGFYLWERLPFSHTIWHVFVLAASACHFIAILFYVIL
jgi:hemolysin III